MSMLPNVRRIVESNEVAGIARAVMERVLPGELVFRLDLQYGIADALWAAGYRKVEATASDTDLIGRLTRAGANPEVYAIEKPVADLLTEAASALSRASQPVQVEDKDLPNVGMAVTSRQSGKTRALVDAILAQADSRGLVVKILEPKVAVTDDMVTRAYRAHHIAIWGDDLDPEDTGAASDRAAIRAALVAALGGGESVQVEVRERARERAGAAVNGVLIDAGVFDSDAVEGYNALVGDLVSAVLAALPEQGAVPDDMVERPEVVVLCGSTRFYDEFQEANYRLTMEGKIVLSVGFYPHAKAEHGHGEGVGHDSAEKVALDELHKRKIDLADRVLVLNVGGYVGASTRGEIEYAEALGKPIDYLSAAPGGGDRG